MKNHQTQMTRAGKGEITPEMRLVAAEERIEHEDLRIQIAEGKAIVPANLVHISKGLRSPIGIGSRLKVKINANIGSSSVCSGIEGELKKLHVAVHAGADTVMDLSTGGDIDSIRKAIVDASSVPVGTVPIYQVALLKKDIMDLTAEDFLGVIEKHASHGVDYMTIHAGVLREFLPLIKKRIAGIVSRGGSLLAQWMTVNRQENPLFTRFDDILDICLDYDVSLSLGDGLRPGAIADATDEAQIAELKVLGKLTERAWEKGVQVMIEGPGHVPLDQIKKNMELEAELCHGAPFYVLGPLVTDIGAGHDHITSAIGGALAGYAGAAMICYVTPKEHLGLPDEEDVREGVIAHKIAAHAADVAKGLKGARERDDEMSRARAALNWEKMFSLALDPEKARKFHDQSVPSQEKYCSMCGPRFCSMKINKELGLMDNEVK